MKTFNNLSEVDWQRLYAEKFYDEYAYHQIDTMGKVVTDEMRLMMYSYDSAKLNYSGNEKQNPEDLAAFHVTQVKKRSKGEECLV